MSPTCDKKHLKDIHLWSIKLVHFISHTIDLCEGMTYSMSLSYSLKIIHYPLSCRMYDCY